MTNETTNPNESKKKNYDLEERTARFGEAVINFVKSLPKDIVTIPLISQLMRSGTSVGANYLEADGASTKKDFRYKITISRKEAKEKKHWLRMIAHAVPEKAEKARILWKEAQELVFITTSEEKAKNPFSFSTSAVVIYPKIFAILLLLGIYFPQY